MASEGLVVDLAARQIFLGGRALNLRPLELRILFILVFYRGRVISAKDISNLLWRDYSYGHLVRWHISHLRKKLKEAGDERVYIRTIRGQGYELAKPVEFI
jgi:DNA-binding response OmpR family regulator